MMWFALVICVLVVAIVIEPYLGAKAALLRELAREKEIENDRKEHEGFEE